MFLVFMMPKKFSFSSIILNTAQRCQKELAFIIYLFLFFFFLPLPFLDFHHARNSKIYGILKVDFIFSLFPFQLSSCSINFLSCSQELFRFHLYAFLLKSFPKCRLCSKLLCTLFFEEWL